MKLFKSIHVLAMALIMTLSFVGSGCTAATVHKDYNAEQTTEAYFIEKAFKTWQSIDVALDMTYTILGDMYRDGQITETQKDKFIDVGRKVRVSMDEVKIGLAKYAEMIDKKSPEIETTKPTITAQIKGMVKMFFGLSDEVDAIYFQFSGNHIPYKSVFVFADLLL